MGEQVTDAGLFSSEAESTVTARPTVAAEYAERVARVRDWLGEERLQAAYVSSPTNIAYLSGLAITPFERLVALVVFGDADPILVVPELEGEAGRANPAGFPVVTWSDAEDPYRRVSEVFARVERGGALALEKESLTVRTYERLQAALGLGRIEDLSPLLTELRLRKSEAELSLMQAAADIVDAALAELPARLKAGKGEIEIALELDGLVRSLGAEATPFDTIVLAGPNAALPHGRPGPRPLAEGDLVIVDFGAVVGGYCADVTRTFSLGEPSARPAEIYDIVRRAQERGVDALAPGATCAAVDAAARSVIEEAGYGDRFVHRTGHGLGLEVHEPPSLAGENDLRLETGMVVTVEPGIYVPGFVGVRIEDDVVVTRDGRRSLTRATRELVVCSP